jgi:TRAP-type C4-dicarboxylate transport system substrate-binding protein
VQTQRHAMRGLLVAAAVAAATVGCGESGDDRAGGAEPPDARVLTMANGGYSAAERGFSVDDEALQAFADEVRRRSGGKLRIEFRNRWLGWPWRRPESAVPRDVASGKAQLGWVGSRAWDELGVPSFDALHAPLLVDSYALEERVLESDVPRRMLASLEPLGLVGIGILPGPMRKLLDTGRALTQPPDFAGRRIGITESQVARDALRALGATPVPFPPGAGIGGLDAIEQQVASIESNTYDAAAKYLSDVNLWPRPLVVFMNAEAFASLRPADRDALRQAARAAIRPALETTLAHERAAAAALCRRGVEFPVVTAADRAWMRRAVAPVVARLERDASTRASVAAIERLRRRGAAVRERLPACSRGDATEGGVIPNGTYAATTTFADARRARIPAGDPLYRRLPIRHRLVLDSGDYVLHDTERGGERSTSGGTYTVYRDRIVFRDPPDTLPFTWSFGGGTLRFDDHGKGGYFGAWFTPPWTKLR